MSKEVQPYIYIDENVSSIKSARNRIESALFAQKTLKAELWGLVMATPKDITTEGEDPIANVKERFEYIWDSLWDAFIDDYKYTVVADDAEYNEDSLVRKVWEKENNSLEKLKEEENERVNFFNKFRGVLSPYNLDDYKIYQGFKDGEIVITEPFTPEQRNLILQKISEKEKETLSNAFKQMKQDGK